MEINMEYKSFKDFSLLEKQGIPDGIIQIADKCANFIINVILKNGIFDNHKKITAVFKPEDTHPSFPVSSISINIIHKLIPFLYKTEKKNIIAHGGYSSGSLKTGKELSFLIESETILDLFYSMKNSKPKDFSDEFKTKITSTIFHELLHAYEDYNRTIGLYGSIGISKDSIISSTTHIVRRSNSDLDDDISSFLFLVYASATHEINARVTEVYPLIRDIKDLKIREQIIKTSEPWKLANRLIDFSGQDFKNKLEKYCDNNDIELKDLISDLNKIISDCANSEIDIYKENTKKISKEETDKINSLILNNQKAVAKLTKHDSDIFFNIWQRKFNTEGQNSKRKLSKLLTI